MFLVIEGHSFAYEMESLCRIFFPQKKIKVLKNNFESLQDDFVLCKMLELEHEYKIWVSAAIDSKKAKSVEKVFKSESMQEAECELKMAQALFKVLSELTAYRPPWGILTGVRPAKLMLKLIEELGPKGAEAYFRDHLLVKEDKTALAQEVALSESSLIKKIDKKAFSLYVAIPFCPSRCGYCSFVSHSIAGPKAKKSVEIYIENLIEELEYLGKTACALGMKAQSVYFGGGTPTSLSANQLEKLFSTLEASFDLSQVKEYSVEAGRPETIDQEKLNLFKKYEVDRISINPQSFNDKVLQDVKRGHTADSTLAAYSLARKVGFKTINMDLIAGLPGDSIESFERSVEQTLALEPENITIHTLALKRAADMQAKEFVGAKSENVSQMLNTAYGKLRGKSYLPYYMYRQSLTLGNLENTGWSKEGHECLYNIIMMEECQSVFAAGAGAVTKLIKPEKKGLERVFNFKYPYEYNSRFSEILKRKDEIIRFFESA